MRAYAKPIENTDPAKIFAHLGHMPYAIFLDSVDRDHVNARYSYIGLNPERVIKYRHGDDADPFKTLRDALPQYEHTLPDLPPFQGGVMGLFGYDLGRSIETIPNTAEQRSAIPDMVIGMYNEVIAFDHAQDKGWIIVRAENGYEAERKFSTVSSIVDNTTPHQYPRPQAIEWVPQTPANDYKANIAHVIEYIKAGDIFQANLAQRFEAHLPDDFDPLNHYMALRMVNPAPYSAYMNLGNTQVSSASPEQFLSVRNGNVTTKPIKGTMPRYNDPTRDEKSIHTLKNSAKDIAENTMIVDLLRNDLSRICTPTSVDVPALCALESFASVHHLVSTVTGTIKPEHDGIDLIKACFPGGSITGAPKIRAMEIIEELEPSRRGAYCGSIGYIGYDGAIDLNILIRTLIFENGRATLNSGGGITAQSNIDDEYQETLDKAAAMFRSFDA